MQIDIRRSLMKSFLLIAFAIFTLALLSLSISSCGAASSNDGTASQTDAAQAAQTAQADLNVFTNKDFNFQLIRTAGAAPHAADRNECLQTAYKIIDGNVESWYKEWYALAESVKGAGETAEKLGNKETARNAFARASNYYRNAGFFLSEKPLDSRTSDTWTRSVGLFRRAAAMYEPAVEYVEIPYDNTVIPAYFYRGSTTTAKLPTVIIHQGFDGSKEESMPGGIAAQQHGYNCLIFEGPGQGQMLHDKGAFFRPDWEAVVTPTVDYLLQRSDVEPSKIALIGFSMGGYLAPRAASGEHRLAAVVANGGVYSVFEGVSSHWTSLPDMPQTSAGLLEYIRTKPDEFNQIAYGAMEYSIGTKWSLAHGMYIFGVSTPAEYFLKLSEMTLDQKVQNITTPVLVVDSENDHTFPGQPKKLYESLTGKKDFLMFTAEEGADLHCQAGAAEISWKKTYEWLDKTLKDKK
jgi:dienelactone hydrolase